MTKPKSPVQTQYEALQAVGFIQRIDKITFVTLALTWVLVLVFNKLCTTGVLNLTPFNLVVHLQCCIFALLLWAIVLIFRCMYFVVQLTAKVNLMPYESARILAAARTTGTLPPVPGVASK